MDGRNTPGPVKSIDMFYLEVNELLFLQVGRGRNGFARCNEAGYINNTERLRMYEVSHFFVGDLMVYRSKSMSDHTSTEEFWRMAAQRK